MDGFNTTERFIEVPWCFARRGNAATVLDCGYANAEPDYLQSLVNLGIADLHGLDIAPPKHITVTLPDGSVRPLLKPVQSDMRDTPFLPDQFDLIFCISTIEHVGMDNERYARGGKDQPSGCGDFEALRELCRITRPGGRLLLTVPFGTYENHGWFRQYDLARLVKLCGSCDFSVLEMQFFRYRNGWSECFPGELATVGYQTGGAVNAAGLACIELQKPAERAT